eukprot:610410-Prorocentrum_minimum.AAC.1
MLQALIDVDGWSAWQVRGVSAEAIALSDSLFHIPLVGVGESYLDMSVAAAVALHHARYPRHEIVNK